MKKNANEFIDHNPIVSSEVWLKARKELLSKEKAFTRMRDQLSAERRALPWVRIDKPYVFDSPHGKKTLADLFDGRTQLFIKHFMMGPGWKEGCVGCSFGSDHLDAARVEASGRSARFCRPQRRRRRSFHSGDGPCRRALSLGR